MEKSREYYPLTSSQNMIFSTSQSTLSVRLAKKCSTLVLVFEWNDTLADENLIKQAAQVLIDRNDSFRVRIERGLFGKHRQYINQTETPEFGEKSFSTDEEYEAWLAQAYQIIMPVFNVPLYKFVIVKRPNGKMAFWIAMHHIMSDGYSHRLTHDYFSAYYLALQEGKPIPDLKEGSFLHTIQREIKYLNSNRVNEDRAFWKNMFDNETEYSVPGGWRTLFIRADTHDYMIENETYEKLMQACAEFGCSHNMLLMCAVAMTTYKLSKKRVFPICSLSYGRTNAEARRTIGCLANTPVLMYHVDPQLSFKEFTMKHYRESIEAMRHVEYPQDKLTLLTFPRAIKNGMKFNYAWFAFSPMEFEAAFAHTGVPARSFIMEGIVSQMYCSVFHHAVQNKFHIELKYQMRKYPKHKIQRYSNMFNQVLNAVLSNPHEAMETVLSFDKPTQTASAQL